MGQSLSDSIKESKTNYWYNDKPRRIKQIDKLFSEQELIKQEINKLFSDSIPLLKLAIEA